MEKINEYNICFVGGIYLDEDFELSKSKNSLQTAANKFQHKIIKGLSGNIGGRLDIISSKFIGSFPNRNKQLIVKGKTIRGEKTDIYEIGFLNLWGIKNIVREIKIYRALLKYMKSHSEKTVFIIYSLHSPFINSIFRLKKRYPKIVIHIIIPDLPEYMKLSEKKGVLYSFFKKIDARNIRKKIVISDSYTLLTREMASNLKIENKLHTVIEGISDNSLNLDDFPVIKKNKTFLYTGTLNWKYGLKDLIDAFINLGDETATLEICGGGEAKEEIERISMKYNNIKYYGLLSRTETIMLQRKATFLVNPRKDEGEYTRYSFPSKIIEYLSSGTITLAYKLGGIPEEYYKYIEVIDENDPQGLLNKMRQLLNYDKNTILNGGRKSMNFILKHKNEKVQSIKIINIINDSIKQRKK